MHAAKKLTRPFIPVNSTDARRNGFVNVIRKAMGRKLGDHADEVMKVLNERGITKKLAKEALEIARRRPKHGMESINCRSSPGKRSRCFT